MDSFKSNLKEESHNWSFRIPTTEVGGFFKSSLLPLHYKYGYKESVRLDLNYPPTPVGGIADFDEDAACRLV